jgi:hypothetical protein
MLRFLHGGLLGCLQLEFSQVIVPIGSTPRLQVTEGNIRYHVKGKIIYQGIYVWYRAPVDISCISVMISWWNFRPTIWAWLENGKLYEVGIPYGVETDITSLESPGIGEFCE